MKFAFLSLLFKRYPLEYSFQMAQKYNFHGLEIWGARPHAYPFDHTDCFAAQIRKWKEQYHVEVPMYTPELLAYPYNLSSESERERMETIDYLKKAILFCHDMECPEMLVTSDHPGYNQSLDCAWENLVNGLKELSDFAALHDVILRIEPLGPNTSPIVSRSDDIVRLIRDVNSPNLKGMMDMAIPPLVAEPFSVYFTKLKEDFQYVHLCGCDGIYETHFQITPESSPIRISEFLQILKSYGYDSWCSLEILDPYYRDPEYYLAEAVSVLSPYF